MRKDQRNVDHGGVVCRNKWLYTVAVTVVRISEAVKLNTTPK